MVQRNRHGSRHTGIFVLFHFIPAFHPKWCVCVCMCGLDLSLAPVSLTHS